MTIILQKQKVYSHLQDEKVVLYNYVTNILLDRIFSRKILDGSTEAHIIASQKETNRFLNQNFKQYLTSTTAKNHGLKLNVSIKTPHQEKALQAVDFVSWAIFRKYERNDESYYKIIKGMIEEENYLFGS